MMASNCEIMVQCELRDGARVHVAWIPKRLAVKGKAIDIDIMPGKWMVMVTYASMEYREANERSQDHTKHRDFSDA